MRTFAVALGVAVLGPILAAQQQPTFREAVDTIEFDVSAVTDSGAPVIGLAADKFEVKIDGKIRPVVSADLIQYGQKKSAPKPLAPLHGAAIWPDPIHVRPNAEVTRTFVLVIDTATLDVGSAVGVVQTARAFVERLRPEDQIGLYVFPTGSQISPTSDHKKILAAIGRVTGQPSGLAREFGLRPSELVGLSPAMARGDAVPRFKPLSSPPQPLEFVDRLILAVCGSNAGACYDRLYSEIQQTVIEYEQEAQQSFSMLRSLVANLADLPGHKTLVMVSGGIVTSDRPGGRPEVGSLGILIGQEAVRTNTAIYTLFIDWRYTQMGSAEQRRANRTLTTVMEDSNLLSKQLDEFTGASGGAFFKALSGRGEAFFDRLLTETSAYDVLGVQPDPKDRDGRPRQLSVRVKQAGVTVRGSRWVTVPKR